MKILIIDPDSEFRDDLANKLTSRGCKVDTTEHALYGLSYLLKPENAPQSIIVNVRDTYLPGDVFLRVIRADPKFAQIKIVFMCEELINLSSDYHNFESIKKPVNMEQLVEIIFRLNS